MDPFSLILSLANCASQWAIAVALWCIVAIYWKGEK
jgi:hypothetical protein